MARAPAGGGEVGRRSGGPVEPGAPACRAPGRLAGDAVHELRRAGDVGDAAVPERRRGARRRPRCRGGRRGSRREAAAADRRRPIVTAGRPSSASSASRGSSTRRSERNTPSTRPLGGEPAVAVDLGARRRARTCSTSAWPRRAEHRLDAGDERREERVGAEQLRLARARPARRASARARDSDRAPVARRPAELGGAARIRARVASADARAPVERERDRALRHAGAPRHVVDRGAGHHLY